MTQITGGKVSFRRNVQPAQYEGREANVEIGFAVDEGAPDEAVQAILTKAGDMAKGKVLELIANDKAPAAGAATVKTTETKPAKETKPPKDTKPAGKTKADLEAELTAKLSGKPAVADELTETKPQISSGEERKDPAQPTDPDGLDGDVLDLGVKEYTDKALQDTASRAMAAFEDKTKGALAIKAVRAKYTTGAIATIAKEHRAKFVAEIEALVEKK